MAAGDRMQLIALGRQIPVVKEKRYQRFRAEPNRLVVSEVNWYRFRPGFCGFELHRLPQHEKTF
jgi:hypothetical protein